MPWTLLGADHDGHLCTSDRFQNQQRTRYWLGLSWHLCRWRSRIRNHVLGFQLTLALSLALKPQNPGK